MNNDDITFNSLEEASDFLLHNLNGSFETETIIEEDRLVLPEWNVSIIPKVADIKENAINTYYYIGSPDWDRMLFECSVGMGADIRQMMGMAQGSFVFGLGNALGAMFRDDGAREIETEFAGNTHKWKVYLGNIVGMGTVPKEVAPNVYWEALSEGIAKRIGNQKLCYVKVYGANIGDGSCIGECRINDIKIDELSKIVEDMVKTWGITEFGSHKQFFMIKQDNDTILDYPFTYSDILDKTEQAIKMFENCKTEEEYDSFEDNLEQVTGDKHLAWELYAFIPEICAENAFNTIKYPETITMNYSGKTVEYYKTQLASYYAIYNGIFNTFERGRLKDSDTVYNHYIATSSICSVVYAAKQDGKDILSEEGGSICIMYNPDDDYIAR